MNTKERRVGGMNSEIETDIDAVLCIKHIYRTFCPRVVTGESGIVLCGGMELRLLLELFTR